MRTRDEVLREFPNAQLVLTGERTVWRDKLAPEIERMADRIRELEAQQALPPIREKFVRVSDELVAELKAAPSKPVTVAIVEDGNELYMTFREAASAAGVSEAQIEAAAKALYLRGDLSKWGTWEDEMWRYKETYYEDAKAILEAALTRPTTPTRPQQHGPAPEVPRGSDE